ncbi:hypothetical protein BT93_G0006 [Corymbia citriodora subsp. variegata]|nr:hypothetical protein BT93_G0006 [Corymbia citriodora subsp. variegata]
MTSIACAILTARRSFDSFFHFRDQWKLAVSSNHMGNEVSPPVPETFEFSLHRLNSPSSVNQNQSCSRV